MRSIKASEWIERDGARTSLFVLLTCFFFVSIDEDEEEEG